MWKYSLQIRRRVHRFPMQLFAYSSPIYTNICVFCMYTENIFVVSTPFIYLLFCEFKCEETRMENFCKYLCRKRNISIHNWKKALPFLHHLLHLSMYEMHFDNVDSTFHAGPYSIHAQELAACFGTSPSICMLSIHSIISISTCYSIVFRL